MKYIFLLLFGGIVSMPFEIFAQRVYSEDELKEICPFQPSKKRFKFSKRRFKKERQTYSNSEVDTNAVYVSSFIDPEVNDTLYIFKRFFSSGEVYTSFPYWEMPSEKEFNDFSYGKFGMYRIKNNELIDEHYVHNDMNHFHYDYAKIKGDRLWFYRFIIGGALWGGSRVPFHYLLVKKEVNLYNYKIAWE